MQRLHARRYNCFSLCLTFRHFAYLYVAILLSGASTFGFLQPAFAFANSGITYHGRIVLPSGASEQSSAVQFQMQIRSPGSESCLLYQEQQTINMAGTNGVFSITINDGTGTRTDSSGYSLDNVLSNRSAFTLPAGSCASGTSYTPNFADGRVFQVSFLDQNMSAWEPVPSQTLNFAPMAIQAKYVGGFSPANLLRFDDTAALSNTSVLNSTQLTNLISLINGTSTQYMQESTLTGAALPVMTGAPVSPVAGSVWFDPVANDVKYYNGTTTQALGSGTGGSGTVTSVAAGTGLSGGPITSSGTLSLATFGTAGTYYKVTTDATGRVSSGATALVEADIPNLVSAGKVSGNTVTSGTIAGTTAVNTSGAITTTGLITGANLSTSSVSTKALNLFEPTSTYSVNLSAPTSLAANYNFILPTTVGSANQVLQTNGAGQASWVSPSSGTLTSVTAGAGLTGGTITSTGTIALTSGVMATPGTYNSVTVDTYGRVTGGTSPTTLAGYGITNAVTNAGGTPSVQTGLDAAKSPAGTAGRVYVATDTQKIYSDSGSAWTIVGSNSGTGGTVTSVALTAPSIFSVSGSPLTTSGTLAVSLASETAHQIFAAPQGSSGTPTFRNFNISDLMSSVAGGFLTGTTCSAGQALTYSAITDAMSCNSLTLTSGQVTTALGYTPVINNGSAPSVQEGLLSAQPAAGNAGAIYVAKDTKSIYRDNGSSWDLLSNGSAVSSQWAISGSNISYTAGNVGVGTTTPVNELDVSGSLAVGTYAGTTAASVANSLIVSGPLGVGTANPTYSSPANLLDVSTTDTTSFVRFENTNSTSARWPTMVVSNYMGTVSGGFPIFSVQNSRGTLNVPTTMQSQDPLGEIEFAGYDGSTTDNTAANIIAYTTQAWTSSAHGSQLMFQTTPNNSTTYQPRMLIDQSGNVGIGTTSPSSILEINGAQTLDEVAAASAPTPAAGKDFIYADNSTHTLKASMNGGAYANVLTSATVGVAVANGGTGNTSMAYVALTYGATTTWTVAGLINNATVTLTGNTTLAFSGLSNGMTGTLIVTQDATGSRTLSLPSACTNKVIGGGSGTVTLTTAGGGIDILTFTYDGTNCYWTYGKNYN